MCEEQNKIKCMTTTGHKYGTVQEEKLSVGEMGEKSPAHQGSRRWFLMESHIREDVAWRKPMGVWVVMSLRVSAEAKWQKQKRGPGQEVRMRQVTIFYHLP